MISSSASGPAATRSSGSVASGSSTTFELREEIVAIGLDVDQAGRELAAARAFRAGA